MPGSHDPVPRLDAGGLVVAVVGFGLTRYTVLESLCPDASLVDFLVSEAPILAAGFALTAFGVGLAISSRDPGRSRLIAGWCLLGTAGMGAVAVLTYAADWPVVLLMAESRLIANALVGGAVGGTLTGVRSAATRRHRRDVARQADRLTVLNHLLRHEVLNKVNVIAGYAATDGGAVRVHIVDDGPGLPPAQQRLIRDDATPDEDDPKVGFGLATVQFMLDDIDGALAVKTPVADGRGTALTVTLRRSDAPAGRLGVGSGHLRCGAVTGLIAGAAMGW